MIKIKACGGQVHIMKIVSLESLKLEWLKAIKRQTGQNVEVVSRDAIQKKRNSIGEAEVLICRDRDLKDDFMKLLVKIKWIFIVSTGVDKLPFAVLKERGIQVVNSPNISDEAMSDYTMGAMMLYSCKFKDLLQYQKEKFWKPYAMTDPLYGKNLLVVGAGKIGRRIATKAKAFGMNLYGICRESRELSIFDDVKGLDSLGDLCRVADYVVCTLPLTSETKYIFNEDVFRKMKKDTVFINISRGGLVDTNGLVKCLKENVIAGAVLDVFEKEPIGDESELWEIENLVITPHSSGRIENYLEQSMKIFCENLCEYIGTGRLIDKIDLEKGY